PSLHGSALEVELIRLDIPGATTSYAPEMLSAAKRGEVSSRRVSTMGVDTLVTIAPAEVEGGRVFGIVLIQSMRREDLHVRGVIEQLRHADRLATVGQLASGVAHEHGTPLNVVTGRAQMIANGELAGAEVTESAMIIHEQGKRMAQIVRQLLDFARTRSVSSA